MKKLLVLSLTAGMAVGGLTWSAQAMPRVSAAQATASSLVTKIGIICGPRRHYDYALGRCVWNR